MSYILYALEFSSVGTSSEDDGGSTFSSTVTQQVTLDVVLSDAEVDKQPQVKGYLLNVFSKSLPTSSHVQTVSWSEGEEVEKHATVYYQQITSSPPQIICLVCEGKVSLTAFYHELDRFSDIVRDVVLEKGVTDPGVKDLLDKWYSECISYVLRVVDYYRADLPLFLYMALSRNDIQITQQDNGNQRVKDTQKFLSACSLKELIYNTPVCVREAEDDVMVDLTGNTGKVIGSTNNFCTKWGEMLEFESDPFVVRQIIEDYKLRSNQDMNIFRRLLRQAETDHYAFFQAYEFIRLHDNGDILLDLALHETTVYSIVGAEELLTILRDFMIKKRAL